MFPSYYNLSQIFYFLLLPIIYYACRKLTILHTAFFIFAIFYVIDYKQQCKDKDYGHQFVLQPHSNRILNKTKQLSNELLLEKISLVELDG